MSFVNRLGKICDSVGVNPKATYPVMLIALVKGICRPTFTMMDKTEKPETKKYTALREGLTELIAIPTYYACGELSAYVAKKIKFKNVPPDVQDSLAKRASKNMMFLGVCGAALFVIPALCSVAIRPIMNKFMPNVANNARSKTNTQVATQAQPLVNLNKSIDYKTNSPQPLQTVYANKFSSGMKVGGL